MTVAFPAFAAAFLPTARILLPVGDFAVHSDVGSPFSKGQEIVRTLLNCEVL
jgi:hypothetical protein